MKITADDLGDVSVCKKCGTLWKSYNDFGPNIEECPTCALRNELSAILKLKPVEETEGL